MRTHIQWCWHLDEVFVRINGKTHDLWRAVDHEGEVLEVFVTKKRDRKATLRFLRRAIKRYGRPEAIVTDKLRSYHAGMIGPPWSECLGIGSWHSRRSSSFCPSSYR